MKVFFYLLLEKDTFFCLEIVISFQFLGSYYFFRQFVFPVFQFFDWLIGSVYSFR